MQLLEHIHKLTLNPKNAARLKELVLELAICGKLTKKWREQNPPQETTESLLQQIKEDLQKQQNTDRKKAKTLMPPRGDEATYPLPEGWVWFKIGEVVEIIGGSQPPKRTFIDEERPGYTRLVQIRDFKSNQFKVYVPNKEAKRPFKEDDVMIGRYGPPVFQILRGLSGTYNVALMQASPKTTAITKDFLFYLLKEPRIQNIIIADSERTAGQSGIRKPLLENIIFGLPPLAEQQAIVEIVEQLMQQIEELEQQTTERIEVNQKLGVSSLHQLTNAADDESFQQHYAFIREHVPLLFDNVENIKKLRESILQLAVQGKLTATWRRQNPVVEPADELLDRIKKEKERLVKEKKIKKEKPLSSMTKEEMAYDLPDGWEWCRLEALAKEITYGTSEKAYEVGEVPVLRMGNISSEGKITYNNLKYVTSEIKGLPRLYLGKYDLVFNRTNSYELVGKCGVYTKEDREYTLASYLIKVSLIPGTDPFYLNNYINSTVCRVTQIEPQITKQTNQANFSGSKLKSVLVPIPPLQEQQSIVKLVEQLMQLCDALEEQVILAKEKEESLMQAIIHYALEGKEEVPIAV